MVGMGSRVNLDYIRILDLDFLVIPLDDILLPESDVPPDLPNLLYDLPSLLPIKSAYNPLGISQVHNRSWRMSLITSRWVYERWLVRMV